MTSLPIEMADAEANTTGAKGLGEPVTIPTAAAIANAIFDATGVRITESPLNPPKAGCAAETGVPNRKVRGGPDRGIRKIRQDQE